jgi:glucans biosynthesis protein
VEPKGDWGKGAVQLVEIPTDDEIHDNIVAFWKADRQVKAGDHLRFAYRLYWQDDNPHVPADVGRVVTTRIGRGGQPGQRAADDRNKWKFVISFAGGPLGQLARRYDITADVSASRGKVENAVVIKVAEGDQWRAVFDVNAPGKDQIDLRCVLRLNGRPLTETWVYQYFPPA